MHEKKTFQEFLPEDALIRHRCKIGFYKAKIAPGIFVSKNGEVYDDVRDKELYVYKGGKGYPTVRIGNKNIYLHRILCETFVRYPNIDIKLFVNHKDGDKQNFCLKNLEWSTPSGNCQHAYDSGLREDNRPVLLKDIVTGEIKKFVSLGSCARFLGKSTSSPFYFLRGPGLSPYLGRYDLVLEGSKWKGFTENNFEECRKRPPRAIMVKHVASGGVTVYSSARNASIKTGIGRTTISERASGKRQSIVSEYEFTWVDEYKGIYN